MFPSSTPGITSLRLTMKYHGLILTGAATLQGLLHVQAQSGAIDCSDPAGMSLIAEL